MEYEIMFILRPDLGEEATNKEIEEIRQNITSNGGEIQHEDIWGIRDFAYRIKKEEQGFYVVFNFTLEPEKIRKLEKPLNLNQNLLRYLVIKTPKGYEIKTLEQYEEEAEKEEKPKKTEKKSRSKAPAPKKTEEKIPLEEKKVESPSAEEKPEIEEEKEEEKPELQEEPKEEPEEEPEEEPKEEPEPEKEEKPAEPSKSKLDEVDEKLKSIINDPDISL